MMSQQLTDKKKQQDATDTTDHTGHTAASQAADTTNWHITDIKKIYELTGSRQEGLPGEEAEKRLEQYGPNQLEEKKKRPAWMMFLLQFKDLMILILLAAAVVSGIAGDLKDTIVILVIVIINAVVGFVQEYRAEKAMEALKKMSATHARVKRNGQVTELTSTQLVPGDVVLLEAGDAVPADMRLTESHTLTVDESSLTGESQAVTKSPAKLDHKDVPLGDRINMAYKSTLVTNGRGAGIVVATGMQTEIGNIAKMLQEKESLTPLQKRLTDFSKKLSVAVLAICVLLYVVGLLRGEEPLTMLLIAISLAVAAVPEALPAVITIALARGAKKLVRKNVLIRKLPAVETLGSVTYICSDKTGTLTQNRMTVKDVWVYEEQSEKVQQLEPEQVLLLAMASNQDTKKNGDKGLTGDATEVALVNYAVEQEHYDSQWPEMFPRKQELPFDADRKMMTTVHEAEKKYLVITKGAVESVISICQDINEETITEQAENMAADGQRVIAYSYRIIQNLPEKASQKELEKQQHFCGLVGMIDPPREEAARSVEECKSAGIVPVMITGDHPATAKAIATELGILHHPDDKIVAGHELEKISQEDFEKIIHTIKVYARVSPAQKLRIVKTLQEKDQYVAMTGDGVNDAPALKRANIGVAMGITGTDVSKESAHMILLDDNFATIVKAVKEGRRVFDNIRRFVRYVLSGNFAEILTILMAPLIGLPIPLLPIHILWINLVTDGLPGLALAGEPAEKNVMQRPPRSPGESIFAQGLGFHVLWVGFLMGSLVLGIQAWAIQTGNTHWQTMVFTVLALSQLGHVMAVRSEFYFLYRQGIFSNLPLVSSVLFTFVLQLAIIYIPALNDIFSTAPLSLKELIICIVLSSVVFHAVELEKAIRRKRAKTQGTRFKAQA